MHTNHEVFLFIRAEIEKGKSARVIYQEVAQKSSFPKDYLRDLVIQEVTKHTKLQLKNQQGFLLFLLAAMCVFILLPFLQSPFQETEKLQLIQQFIKLLLCIFLMLRLYTFSPKYHLYTSVYFGFIVLQSLYNIVLQTELKLIPICSLITALGISTLSFYIHHRLKKVTLLNKKSGSKRTTFN